MQYIHFYKWAENIYNLRLNFGRKFSDRAVGGTSEFIIKMIAYCSFKFIVISPIIIVYSFFKSKKWNVFIYIPYLICLVSILFWFKTAPDFRFISGAVLGCCFITIYSVLYALGKTKKQLPRLGYLFSMGSVAFIFIFSLMQSYSLLAYKDIYDPIADKSITQIGKSLLCKPSLNFYSFNKSGEQKKLLDEYVLGPDVII